MFQGRRIELGNGEVHALVLVGDAVVRRIARRIKDLLPSLLPLVRNMTRETLLKVEQSLLVLLNSHGCSKSGKRSHKRVPDHIVRWYRARQPGAVVAAFSASIHLCRQTACSSAWEILGALCGAMTLQQASGLADLDEIAVWVPHVASDFRGPAQECLPGVQGDWRSRYLAQAAT